MKVGFRKPSLKGRIAARTSLKRFARHSLGIKAPRGWGWLTNPKKAAYNRAYNRTTVDPLKLLAGGGRRRSRSKSSSLGCLPIIAFLLLLGIVQEHPWLIVVAVAVGAVWLIISVVGQSSPQVAPPAGQPELHELAVIEDQGGQGVDLCDLPGVGPKMAQTLAAAGYATIEDVRAASDEQLLLVRGMGPGTVKKIRAYLAG